MFVVENKDLNLHIVTVAHTQTAFSVRLRVLPAAQHTPNRKSLHSRSKGNGSSTRHFLHGNPHKPSRDPGAVPPRVLELPLL